MKKIAVVILLFVVALSACNQDEKIKEKQVEALKTIVLLHPTDYNLDLFKSLIDKGIFPISKYKVVGLYHALEKYDYSGSESFIEENKLDNYSFYRIEDTLYKDNLYQKNGCSSHFEKLFRQADAIIFLGGPDMPPAVYKDSTSLLCGSPDSYRHYLELSFMYHLLGAGPKQNFSPLMDEKKELLILGICLGMQTMNVACGGSMYQDIPSEIYGKSKVEEVLAMPVDQQHRNYYNQLYAQQNFLGGSLHPIRLLDGFPSELIEDTSFCPWVYSNHHQAVKCLGANLKVIATSLDGKIIEAIAHTKYPHVLGVQFHPEGKFLHNENDLYSFVPNGESKSAKKVLEEKESYQFQQELWKMFAAWIR